MLLVVYDIQDDKLRTRFSKCLSKYGRRIQFSVFEIFNSPRILANIQTEVTTKFEKYFCQGDSVLVFSLNDNSCVAKFGYPVNEETDLIIR